MPYVNGEFLTDDEMAEREMAQRRRAPSRDDAARAQYAARERAARERDDAVRAQYAARERDNAARASYTDDEWREFQSRTPPIRSMYQPDAAFRDAERQWRELPSTLPAGAGRPQPMPWSELTEEPRGPEIFGPMPFPWDPYQSRSGGGGQGIWQGPRPGDRLERLPAPPEEQMRRMRPPSEGGALQASGQRARGLARQAFSQRPPLARSPPERRGGRRGRPASHPGAGERRRGFRLGDLLSGVAGRIPRQALMGVAGSVPGAFIGGRRS